MDQHSNNLLDVPVRAAGTDIVYGSGTPMKALNAMASEIARTNLSVLIVGESGTGKDTYARLIHSLSRASDALFRKINCTVLDPERLSSLVLEATRDLAAHPVGGTLYLDNLQELDLAGQRALFSQLSDSESALQNGHCCTRFISSSTRSLDEDVESGRFRRELYFRINGVCLRLPPLRERKEDFASLLKYFLVKHCSSSQTRVAPLSKKAIDILANYHWPGNIREFDNFALRVAAFGDVQTVLQELQLGWKAKPLPAPNGPAPSLKTVSRAASRQAEREMIMHALEHTRWNRKRAAQELQISYKSLLYKIKQIGAFHGDREN
jgi:two-component system, NtrC family, response regulator AtoC